MQRIPEPELMDDREQAQAYAAADFEAANASFVEQLEALHGGAALAGRVLDLGCGPADICVRLASRYPALDIHALDGSEAMLDCARERLNREPALAGRIRLLHARLPVRMLPATSYDLIISNSLLHHLHDPTVLWDTVRRFAHPGTRVLVMDLFRPASQAAAREIVERYSAREPQVLKTDFHNSLLAAFTPAEVAEQLRTAGLGTLEVRTISDRHLLVAGQLG